MKIPSTWNRESEYFHQTWSKPVSYGRTFWPIKVGSYSLRWNTSDSLCNSEWRFTGRFEEGTFILRWFKEGKIHSVWAKSCSGVPTVALFSGWNFSRGNSDSTNLSQIWPSISSENITILREKKGVEKVVFKRPDRHSTFPLKFHSAKFR